MVADKIRDMMRSMNVKSPKELGYSREEFLALWEATMTNHLASYCPVHITEDVAKELLAKVYDTYQ